MFDPRRELSLAEEVVLRAGSGEKPQQRHEGQRDRRHQNGLQDLIAAAFGFASGVHVPLSRSFCTAKAAK